LLGMADVPANNGWKLVELIGKHSNVALAKPFVIYAFAPYAMIHEFVTGSFWRL